jgi:hypothetical protein
MRGAHVVVGTALLLAHVARVARGDDVQPPSETPPIGPALLIDNPYVEPAHRIGAYGSFDLVHSSITDAVNGTTVGFTTEGLSGGAGYGITDRITAGAQYRFPLIGDNADDTRFRGPLALYGMYLIARGDRLVLAATADVTLNLCGANDLSGDCAFRAAIHAGVAVRYKLARRVALYSGEAVGPGPVGDQLTISLDSGGPSALGLPLGVAVQATDLGFAFVQTELLRLNLANGPGNVVDVIGPDPLGVPLAIGGLYRLGPRTHLGVQVAFPDLKHAGDAFELAIAVRWYQ